MELIIQQAYVIRKRILLIKNDSNRLWQVAARRARWQAHLVFQIIQCACAAACAPPSHRSLESHAEFSTHGVILCAAGEETVVVQTERCPPIDAQVRAGLDQRTVARQ